tara:strand:+ start:470 stop:1021 length:552 start_codon:yes stop_codon:yes gene_type:complete
MFNIPAPLITKVSTSKTARTNYDKTILGDKIVSKSTDPTLYNVQSGLTSLKSKTGLSTRKTRTTAVNKDRPQLAEEMLMLMNVAIDDLPRDFSLLESDSNKEEENNPNIIDTEVFSNTVNSKTGTGDKFKDDNDPFYQLDEDNSSREKEEVKKSDPSFIAASFTVLNQSPVYYGKNKYFKGTQ